MVDDKDGMGGGYEWMKGLEEFGDVVEVEGGGRVVEDE